MPSTETHTRSLITPARAVCAFVAAASVLATGAANATESASPAPLAAAPAGISLKLDRQLHDALAHPLGSHGASHRLVLGQPIVAPKAPTGRRS